MSHFQAATEAQTGQTELVGGARLVVVAHIHLAEGFHVVDIHAHGVAESVRQEEGVGTGGHRSVDIALHQAESL